MIPDTFKIRGRLNPLIFWTPIVKEDLFLGEETGFPIECPQAPVFVHVRFTRATFVIRIQRRVFLTCDLSASPPGNAHIIVCTQKAVRWKWWSTWCNSCPAVSALLVSSTRAARDAWIYQQYESVADDAIFEGGVLHIFAFYSQILWVFYMMRWSERSGTVFSTQPEEKLLYFSVYWSIAHSFHHSCDFSIRGFIFRGQFVVPVLLPDSDLWHLLGDSGASSPGCVTYRGSSQSPISPLAYRCFAERLLRRPVSAVAFQVFKWELGGFSANSVLPAVDGSNRTLSV